jgi:hypothetical protein
MRAVLFTYVPETGETMATEFTEGPDPVQQAYGLKAGIEGDWPGAVWAVGADQDAKEAHGAEQTKRMLG